LSFAISIFVLIGKPAHIYISRLPEYVAWVYGLCSRRVVCIIVYIPNIHTHTTHTLQTHYTQTHTHHHSDTQ